ncbi:CSF1 (YLR087C) [Zygosaccharomyces parabailii]|nr:CSF1 (YLR087C) [Zygosaccharomyces parabailii]
MVSHTGFQKVSLSKTENFSWVFLVDWILTCIVTLTVIFYFGRIIGYLLGFIFEWVLWRRFKIKVNIESLRIAPLSGSIVFRNVCIIHRDYTISCMEGSINWRYWLWNVRRSQYEESLIEKEELEGGDESKDNRKHPCRFQVECEGLEIFVYNKTAAYENIIHMFSKEERAQFEKFVDDQTLTELLSKTTEDHTDKVLSESTPSSITTQTVHNDSDHNNTNNSIRTTDNDDTEGADKKEAFDTTTNDRVFDQQYSKQKTMFMRFLPMQILIHRFSIVLGNRFTSSILIGSSQNAKGTIDLCQPREKLDIFKIKLENELLDVDVSVKQNIGFDDDISTSFRLTRGRLSKLWKTFAHVLHLPIADSRMKQTPEDASFHQSWKGLALYRQSVEDDELENIEFDFANHEYAKVSNILKSTRVIYTYEYDVPGLVPHGAQETLQGPEVGNSGAPPELKIDIQIYGATICYGPWAERQVSHLRRMLSPVVSRTPKPIKTLLPGSRRIYTVFRTSITIMEECTWRIPTREKSKDQDFLKHYIDTNEEFRPFGWIDLKFFKDSYGILDTVLCPTEEGSPNDIIFHFSEPEIRSSVNHELLLRSKSFDFEGDLGFPLGWNEEAIWEINLSSTQLEIFLLREHITLLSDVFSDFASGDPTPYELFRPFLYKVNWTLDGYSIYLNVNDHNIVNNPLDFNENCYLSLHGDLLSFKVEIPHKTITHKSTDIVYCISTPMFRLLLNTPPWNTLNEFMKNKEVGRAYEFSVNGLYTIFSDLDVDHVDTVSVECSSTGTTLHCYGFVIRYLMNVKMNYFGDFSHFMTSEEYTSAIQKEEAKSGHFSDENSMFDINSGEGSDAEKKVPVSKQDANETPIPKRSDLKRTENESDIWFIFSVWEGALILPETIYNSDPCTALHFGELMVDLRSTNYYMDLLATMNNTQIKRYVSRPSHELFDCVRRDNGRQEKNHGSLTTLTIHGHRMYGLPPIEPTYFCQWGVDLDHLEVDSDVNFAKGFFTCFSKIGFGFKNMENTLLYEIKTLYDMTSVTVRAKELKITVNDEDSNSKIVLDAKKITFTSIDFENEAYSQRIDLKIPAINVMVLKMNQDNQSTNVLFELRTQLNFTNFIQKKNFADHRYKQREYIALHDSPFYRCPFILPCFFQESVLYTELLGSISPSSTLPPLPLPVVPKTVDYIIEDLLGNYASFVNHDYSQSPGTSHNTSGSSSCSDEVSSHTSSKFFSPHSSLNSRDRYNNYVFDIEFITVTAAPTVSDVVSSYLEKFYKEGTIDIIDENEVAVVKKLGSLQYGASFVTTIKLHVKSCNVSWDYRSTNGIDIFLDNLDFDLGERTIENEDEKVTMERTSLVTFHSLRANLSDTFSCEQDGKTPALAFTLEGFEVWSSTVDENVNSLNVASVDMTVDESQLEEVSIYLVEQGEKVLKVVSSAKWLQNLKEKFQKDLICDLTSASEYYQISHDPYVITKPAFIMRLSKGHVRENRSWRIITRLRHILTYLPKDWRTAEHFVTVKDSENPNVPQNDKDIFVSVFSNWRNWDLSDVTRSYLYRKIFLPGNTNSFSKELRIVLKLHFQSIFITMLNTDNQAPHNVVITRANAIADILPPSVNTNAETLFKQEKIINFIANVGAIKGEISDQLLKLRSYLPNFNERPSQNSFGSNGKVKNLKFYLTLIFERSDLQLILGSARLTNRVMNGRCSMLIENSKEYATPALSAVFFAQRFEVWLKHSTDVLAEVLLWQFCLAATVLFDPNMPTVSINGQSAKSLFSSMPSTAVMADSVEYIKESIEKLAALFNSQKEKAPAVSKAPSSPTVSLEVRLKFADISSEVTFLSPLFLSNDIKEFQVYASGLENIEVIVTIIELNIYLKSQQSAEQYCRLSMTDLQLRSELSEDNSPVLDTQMSASLIKLSFAEPRRILHNLLRDEKILIESVPRMESLLHSIQSKAEPGNVQPDVSQEKSFFERFRWAVDANLKYFGILIPMSSICYAFELHSLVTSLTNAGEQYVDHDRQFSGQLTIESCLFLVKESSLPANLSKVLDFSIRFLTSQKAPGSLQSYQIESSYFRVCLFPEMLVNLMWSIHHLQSLSHHFKKHHVPWFPHSRKQPVQHSESSLDFRSIHILSYGFCVGWLFQLGENVEPGLILGYDRLFSAYEKNFGKLTLIDGYLSVANGSTSDSFYSQKSEKEEYNRTHLSNMQISYWLKGSDLLKDLFVRFHGEAIDVRFMSTSFRLVELTVQSICDFEEMKRTRIRQAESAQKSKMNVEAASNSIAPFLAHIRTINSIFNFGGGVFKVYSPNDIGEKSEPMLEIKSPGVQIAINYEFNETKKKPHWVRILTTVEPTHNTLFAKCAPLLTNFAENVKSMVRRFSSDDVPQSPKPNSEGINYKSLIKPYDLAFEITSGKQKLSFSCEPKAKVQVDTGFDSFLFKITTNDLDEVEPLSVSFSMDRIDASVRHIFSRDTSASFKLEYIDIVLMFTHPEVYGVALISDINVYCNMKQLQNLKLFLDIWKLSNSHLFKPKEKNEDKKELKSSSTSFSASPSNGARKVLPWCFSIIFTNLGGVVDLGPSLGVLTLGLERFWLAADHYREQRRVLHMFIDGITVNSEGRLSGMFELDNACCVYEMTWPEDHLLKGVPLMSFSLDINKIIIKSAFDYHMFLIGTLQRVRIHLHNESDHYALLPDLLQVSLECEHIVLCATALTAANILDIYNTIMRMQQDNKISYIETLRESDSSASQTSLGYDDILKSLNLLRTDLSVTINEFKIHISPMSLFDLEVLVISFKDVIAHSETQSGEKLKTELQLQISDVKASLSSSKEELDEERVSKIPVDDYMVYASKISGGAIINIPKLLVSMTTWQKQNSNVLEYLFTCKFSDKISVKWNLGPVNFIKEMWTTHVKSLAVRRNQIGVPGRESTDKDAAQDQETESKFKYVPLDEPYIEMPQIKDLGDATPPMEWFGVHRKNLPAATHQTAVVLIQKLVHTAEKEYAKIQQRA